MNERERLIELLYRAHHNASSVMSETGDEDEAITVEANYLLANGVTVQRLVARPIEEWHEDYGDVLWWKFPVEEPPYVGSPLDEDWPAYHTHWTPVVVPKPKEE